MSDRRGAIDPHGPLAELIGAESPIGSYLAEMARLGLWGAGIIEEGVRRAVEKQLIPRKYFPAGR
jgi:hypothetical protein